MEGELKNRHYWVRHAECADPEVAHLEGRRWFWLGVDAKYRPDDEPAEVLEPIPTRDELRELREKAELWDRLGEESMHLYLVEGKPHLPSRKATP